MDALAGKLSNKKEAEAGLVGIQELLNNGDKNDWVAALEFVPAIMENCAAKEKPTAVAAEALAKDIFAKAAPWAAAGCLPTLAKSLDGKAKPQTKEIALEILEAFALKEANKPAMGREIEWVVYPVGLLMNDIKKSVGTKAESAMRAIVNCSGNKDLADFTDVVIKANKSPKTVGESVEKLAGCIFVQNVEAPALAVLTPVLHRGLNEKSEQTQRRCCVIIDNMCKLIDDPYQVSPLLKEIYPLVMKRADEISDPDSREMAEKTVATIKKLADLGEKPMADFKEVASKNGADLFKVQTAMVFLTECAKSLSFAGNQKMEDWEAVMGHWMNAKVLEPTIVACAAAGDIDVEEFVDEDTESPDLYKGNFSLAYGTLTLLRDAKLHLKKDKFYGMLGPNNCGKTTLMRAISREQVEGFPKRDELVTIFVEHEVEEREIEPPSKEWPLGKLNIDLNGVEFCLDMVNNTYGKTPAVSYEAARDELAAIGFRNKDIGANIRAAADMLNPITTYSGGWKVKMQLACAKLVMADILMIDEPTGHLDVKNIEWMKDWLNNFKGSIIATSSNSGFLDEMCTHVVDFQDRKLIQFKAPKGTCLTEFVKKYPTKSAYFELSNKNQKFNFPAPGPLEGVKSKGRSILKMTNVCFKYPSHEKNTVQDVCLSVCMLSRVAVIGPNGAGKSTAIKLLIGELTPEQGIVYKHPGMRLAYVAQHAFHHLEKHLDKTPVQYILWRFAGNDDRESLENQSKEQNADEEALKEIKWCIDPKSGVVRKCVIGEKADVPVTPDCILNRRKNKAKKYEYEVKWMFKPIDASVWVERDTMCNMGFEKMVCREDEKQAAAAGLMSKPLTAPSVEKCLKDFGLDAEAASHSPINSLSGGQKVKVVLAAACWQNPHVLILDEPTNYLDRDGLGALSLGLKDFGGGVVIISHNMEFAESVCQQKWIMEKNPNTGSGHLKEEGEIQGDEEIDAGMNGPDEIFDGAGNKIEVNREKTMSDKDRKKVIKEIEKRLKEHKKKNTLSEGEMWELQDKLAEHQAQIAA